MPRVSFTSNLCRHVAIFVGGNPVSDTTGSLWISENQGYSWTAVSQHLPPVYAVPFG